MNLRNTVQKIHVQRVLLATNRDAMFQNFKLSVRGGIRRPPHCMTWVLALMKTSDDASSAIRMWNSMTSRNGQLQGGKAMAVKNVMDAMPRPAINLIESHISRLGWDNCSLTDEVLASKRIVPGYTFRVLADKAWSNRTKVSEASCLSMLRWMFHKFESSPPGFRTKPTKATWEEAQTRHGIMRCAGGC